MSLLPFYFILSLLIELSAPKNNEILLHELDLSSMTSTWKRPQVNKSLKADRLSINGKLYEKGICVMPISKYMLSVNKRASSFSALVGIDDTGNEQSSIEFYVLGDQKILWQSGIMKYGDNPKKINIDIHDINVLALLVTDGNDGPKNDFADWINAKFITTDSTIKPFIHDKEEEYLLTPEPSKTPTINGPSIFGVKKNNPVMYAMPVSGSRPMTYQVKGLPKGLSINKKTGQVTGRIQKKGVYKVLLKAKNKFGQASKNFTFYVGDQISLSPPMGWNSWNAWGKNIDQEKILKAGQLIKQSGLADFGWSFINIDDGWQGLRNSDGFLEPNEKFSDMKELSNNIHSIGLKLGIYSTPWITSFAGYCGTSSDNENGYWSKEKHGSRKFTKMGKFHFEEKDAIQYQNWNIDYLKYDWNPIDTSAILRMSKALAEINRDIVFSISNSSKIEDVEFYKKHVNLWRTTSDIRDAWYNNHTKGKFSQGVADILYYHKLWQTHNSPGNWNDPDMLVVGKVGWGQPRENRLTPSEQYSHMSLWCLWSAPLLLGCDLSQMSDFTKNLITNGEVLAVNQDPLGQQAEIIYEDKCISVLKKQLHDGFAIGVFNRGRNCDTVIDIFDWGSQSSMNVTVPWDDIKESKSFKVRDLWRQKDLGVFSKEITVEVKHHGISLLKFVPVDK